MVKKKYRKMKELRPNGEVEYEVSWEVVKPVRIRVTLPELEAKRNLLSEQLKEVEADIAEIKKLKEQER